MLLVAAVVALTAAAIAGLAIYWKRIIGWIKRSVEKVKLALQALVEGVKTFLVRTGEGLKNLAKYYSRNKITGEWEETVTRKSVNEDEIPKELLARINLSKETSVEIDTTETLEKQLATLEH